MFRKILASVIDRSSWMRRSCCSIKAGHPEERVWSFDYPIATKLFHEATDSVGPIGITMYQTRRSGTSVDRSRGCRILQDVQKRGQWRAFSNVTTHDKRSRLAADKNSAFPALSKQFRSEGRRFPFLPSFFMPFWDAGAGGQLKHRNPTPCLTSESFKT